MKRIVIALAFVMLTVGSAYGQSKSVTGTVVERWLNNKGTSESITVKVGSKLYAAYITRPDLRQPRIVGTVNEVGRVVRVYYTRIVTSQDNDGELRATRIAEIKKSRNQK
jgi:hypothetical protein